MKFYVGYAFKSDLPIPIKHAWTVDGEGNVHDCTPSWADANNVIYYGVHIPLALGKMINDYEDENGTTPSGVNDYFMDLNWAIKERQQSTFTDIATL